MNAPRILAAYRLVFVALIIIASAQTFYSAHLESHAVALLASIEIIAAIGLSVRRTQWLGAWLLLAVFACAQLLSALHGEWPTRFLQYAASALLIVTLDRALFRSAQAQA